MNEKRIPFALQVRHLPDVSRHALQAHDNDSDRTDTQGSEDSGYDTETRPKSAFGFDVPVYGQPQQTFQAPVVEPPKPKLSNTPKDKFERHQDYFSEAVNRAMKKVEDARSLKKGLLEERFVALAKDRFATREIEQIEEDLQTAIDEEDYERKKREIEKLTRALDVRMDLNRQTEKRRAMEREREEEKKKEREFADNFERERERRERDLLHRKRKEARELRQ